MASPESIAIRRAQALDKLHTLAATLGKHFSVEAPVLSLQLGQDPEFARMLELETVGNFLEAIVDKVEPKKAAAVKVEAEPEDAEDAALAEAEATELAEEGALAEGEATRLAEEPPSDEQPEAEPAPKKKAGK